MVQYGTLASRRRRLIHLMMFFGFLMLAMSGAIVVTNTGMFWANIWMGGGVVTFILGILLLMHELIQERNHL